MADTKFPCPVCGNSYVDVEGHVARQHPDEYEAMTAVPGEDDFTRLMEADTSPASIPIPTDTSLKTELTVVYSLLGDLLSMKDPVCGPTIKRQAEALAIAWDNWATKDPKVKAVLTKVLGHATGGASVVVAHLPIAMVIMQHHGPAAQRRRQEQDDENVDNGNPHVTLAS